MIVGYVRLSRDDAPEEGESIANQKQIISDYAASNGYSIDKFYVDDNFSGSDRDRPAFNEMILSVYAGRITTIIVKKQSRFARDLELIERYVLDEFLTRNVRFISVLDNFDTNSLNSSQRRTSQITGLVDQWHIEELSESIKAALTAKKRRGESIASYAPYGYMKDPDSKGRYVIDQTTATIVRRIYAMYVDGYGIHTIAQILNSEKIDNPYGYNRKHNRGCGRVKETTTTFMWSPATISQMLENEVYLGNLVQNKFYKPSHKSKKLLRRDKSEWIITRGTHEPIVDDDTWQKVQTIKSKHGRGHKLLRKHVLSGYLICGICGKKMVIASQSYYRCEAAVRHKGLCPGVAIKDEICQKVVVDKLRLHMTNLLDSDYQVDNISDTVLAEEKNILGRTKSLEKEIGTLTQKKELIYCDRLDGSISLDLFKQISGKIDEELNIKIIELKKLKELASSEDTIKNEVERKRGVVERYAQLDALDAATMSELIDRIIVNQNPDDKTEKNVEIVWKF